MSKLNLILSSTSPSRKQLLERLQIPFTIMAPDIDETPYPNESPIKHVRRLAQAKAKVHAEKFPNSLIIGCDQVAVLGNKIVSKPETHANAVKQLRKSSGKKIVFFTGVSLLNTKTHKIETAVERFSVQYRRLTKSMIENYLAKENAYQCAGSVKADGLGIALFENISGKDPTALIGLPLIRLVKMLKNAGMKTV